MNKEKTTEKIVQRLLETIKQRESLGRNQVVYHKEYYEKELEGGKKWKK